MARMIGVAVAVMALAFAGAAYAREPVGDWLGTVTVNPQLQFRLAIHIRKTPQGGYAGTLDSLERGRFDIPLGEIAATSDTLAFAVPETGARYAAKWDAAARRWDGQWTQLGATNALILTAGIYPPAPKVAGLDGEWDGTLNLGTGLTLRLAFHVTTGSHGTLGTIDSVDQGAYGGPMSGISRAGKHARFEIKALNAVVDGELEDGDRTFVAAFTQNGMTLPLVLKRLPSGAPSPWPAPPKSATAAAPPPKDWTLPTDAEIREVLVRRVDTQHQGVGIVVGVISPAGRRIVAYGARDQGDPRPLDGDTLFEIGSITKVFTALVLEDMVQKGEVKLDDPAARFLPSGVTMPTRGGKAITLADLATHTSGLPRIPGNFAPKDMANPYADYSREQLYAFVSGYTPPRDPGAKWEYSNLGFGLLGDLLARRAGTDYETLVKTRVLGPLGMASTTITLTPDEAARMAVGHDSHLAKAANWDLPTLAGAGALRSTTNDLLTFLGANMGLTETPLKADMAAMLEVTRPTGAVGLDQALGWEVMSGRAGKIIQHGGGTGGFHTFIAFNPQKREGVVVLTNAETLAGGDDIALHILTGSPVMNLAPPAPPPPERKVVEVPAEVLQRYVGVYQMAPGVTVTVTRDGGHLFAQITGQGAYEIFPESLTDFFWKIVDAQVTFTVAPGGAVTGLVLHQNGRNTPARRAP